jgi:hypothetical protein
MVDSWAAAEQSRLTWLRNNQKTLCSDVYKGLVDAVAAEPDTEAHNLGQRTILPSTFPGSSWNMVQYCQDVLAINHHFKGADIFMTVTADPNWPEIQAELLPGQTTADRPDLVSRVFKAKVAVIMNDIKKGALRVSVAHIFTIEFQKRGLPHMHLIIFLHHDYKLRTADDVDSLLSAQLPDPYTQPELYHLVVKYMVHGPRGAYNPDSPCMVDDKCSKNFPKAYREHTTLSDDSYSCLKRPNNGRVAKVGIKVVDTGGLCLTHLGSLVISLPHQHGVCPFTQVHQVHLQVCLQRPRSYHHGVWEMSG